MVKKAKWLKNVKKAFSPESKKLKHEPVECQDSVISYPVLIATSRSPLPQFEVRVDEVNYDQKKDQCPPPSDSVTATDADVLVESPPSSPESVHQAIVDDRFAGKSKKEAASILIQTTFRGYLARRELQAMRVRDRLKLLMEGSVVQRQAANTLKCMQTLTRVQSQIRSRRIRMSEENQVRHKQLLQKHAKELGGLKNVGNWNVSNQSKDQVEAGMLHKNEATMRRERALAYAFTHQQNSKSNSKTENPMFMDPSNPTWGWSWLERWMAGQPWESSEKEHNNNENSLVKNSTNRNTHGGETAKSSNLNKLNRSTQPNTLSASSTTTTTNPRKKKPIPSSIKSKSSDEDTKSSDRNRRHSIASSSVSDDESLAKLSINMVPTTKSARGKLKPQISVSDDESLASTTARRSSNMVPTTKSARGKLKPQTSVSDDESLASTTARRSSNMVPTTKSARGKLKPQTLVSDDESLASTTARRSSNMVPTTNSARGKLKPQTSVSDDESLASTTARRSSNMVPTTKSARGKLKPQTTVSDDESLASTAARRSSNMVPTTKSERGKLKPQTSVSDDESLASTTARRSSNTVPTTKSARGKLKPQTSSRVAVSMTAKEGNKVLPEKAPGKKRLSNSASPAPKPRRSSAPPKVENGVLKSEKIP